MAHGKEPEVVDGSNERAVEPEANATMAVAEASQSEQRREDAPSTSNEVASASPATEEIQQVEAEADAAPPLPPRPAPAQAGNTSTLSAQVEHEEPSHWIKHIYPEQYQRTVASDKRWHRYKVYLLFLSMCWAVVYMTLTAMLSSKDRAMPYPPDANWLWLYGAPISVAVILPGIAELVVIIRHRRFSYESRKLQPLPIPRRGFHPGYRVAAQLIYCLACAGAIAPTVIQYIASWKAIASCNENPGPYPGSNHDCARYLWNYSTKRYDEDFYFEWMRVVLAMFALGAVTHLILFVRACVEVHRRNRGDYKEEDAPTNNA